jgi:hypothetical protein
MKVIISVLILSAICIASCKKAKDRGCFKSFGDVTEFEVTIDSVKEFRLFKGVVYNFYQDTLRKLVITGGENVVSLIEVKQKDYIVSVNNFNSCNFLRNYDNKITVDIHYPHYPSIYAEPTEPMTFVDTLTGHQTVIELRNGGGNLDLNVDVDRLYLDVSYGTGSINVYGKSNFLKLAVQNMGRIDALGIDSKDLFVYQSSRADVLVNFENSNTKVHFSGNGDVKYIGVPTSLEITGEGDGEVITY